jgi:hypothetical protein
MEPQMEAAQTLPAPAPTLLAALRALVASHEATAATQPAPADVQASTGLTLQPGERYAGVVLNADGTHSHHLVLLAAKPDAPMTWKQAVAWAKTTGGSLPTRQEQALLYANCKAQFEPAWHWSSEEEGASYAWDCTFDDGGQFFTRKSYEGHARAVRRA